MKFEGHYHGWLDNVLWGVPSSAAEAPAGGASLGQDPLCGREIEVLRWNDADALRARLSKGDVAAVIMEPVMCNAGVIPPAEGYLEAARAACDENGTLLIFDEVITGFRLGSAGAQGLYGVTPDLAVFGKAIANGFPVACLAGRAELMDLFGRGVVHGGTYNAQAIAMAATVATLESLSRPSFYADLERPGRKLMEGIGSALNAAGIPATVTGFPQVFHVALGLDEVPRRFGDLASVDRAGYVKLAGKLLRRGVRVLERGVWFTSSAHDDAVIEASLAAFGGAVADLRHE